MFKTVQRLRSDESGVSPVIGVILMVAITVILAAVIAAFVLGFGADQESAPQASFSGSFDTDGDGNVTISHTGGAAIEEDRLSVNALHQNGSSIDGFSQSDAEFPGVDEMRAGDRIQISIDGYSFTRNDQIEIVWEGDDTSSVLYTYTIPRDSENRAE